MSIHLVEEDLRARFVALCKRVDIAKPLVTATTQQGVDVPVLHLDRLWHDPQTLSDVTSLVLEALSRHDGFRESRVNTIMVMTSGIGSFGPLPIAALVAKKLTLELIVASECPMGDLTVYPDDVIQNKLRRKNILLFKDGVLRGSSISRAVRLVQSLDGNLRCILILVDVDNPTETSDRLKHEIPTVEFLLGEQINKVKRGG